MTSSTRIACLVVVLALLAVTGAWAGQFTAVYSDVSNPEYREWQAEMQADGVLEGLAAHLNEALSIPADVVITFGECGTANAFYSPEQQAIVKCYELVQQGFLPEPRAARCPSEWQQIDKSWSVLLEPYLKVP